MHARAECINICEKMNAPRKNIIGRKRGNETTGIFSEISFVCSTRRCRMSIMDKKLIGSDAINLCHRNGELCINVMILGCYLPPVYLEHSC